jgi:hypothetical protein
MNVAFERSGQQPIERLEDLATTSKPQNLYSLSLIFKYHYFMLVRTKTKAVKSTKCLILKSFVIP